MKNKPIGLFLLKFIIPKRSQGASYMEKLGIFKQVVSNPCQYARTWKQQTHGKVIGNFCSYTPEELITASGALPFRILGSGATISRADAFLQAYSCSLVRGALEDSLAGRLDFLDGTVFPHTCDSIQRLSDIWRMNTDYAFHADLIMPVKLDTGSAEQYMISVIQKFRKDLETGLGIQITDDGLRKAIRISNQVRNSLARLYEIRKTAPERIKSSELHTVLKASMVMDREQLAAALKELVLSLETPRAGNPANPKRLVLTGGLCSMPDIYDIIESSGGAVIWDDFCTGARYVEGRIEETGDLETNIARRYINRVVCPAKHSGIYARGNYLLEKVKENHADGVIFVFLKFCDPHSFDYPYMKEMLEKEGIPSMLFEIEDQASSGGQLQTRCEAFMEML